MKLDSNAKLLPTGTKFQLLSLMQVWRKRFTMALLPISYSFRVLRGSKGLPVLLSIVTAYKPLRTSGMFSRSKLRYAIFITAL
jgi:hypothetical protein